MAKANLTLPDGTVVTIDGSVEEVARLLQSVSASGGQPSGARASKPHRVRTKRAKAGARSVRGPTGYLLELREEGYFKSKRFLNDIKKKLEEKGHIYARTTLSPTLLNLVKRKELRRVSRLLKKSACAGSS
jgi:hypothetical protein